MSALATIKKSSNARSWLLSVLLLATLSGEVLAQQKVLRVQSYGGAFEDVHKKHVIEPFEKLHNVKIETVSLYSADALAQIRAQKSNPQLDVVHFTGGQEVIGIKEGLLLPLKPEDLENYKNLYSIAQEPLKIGAGPGFAMSPHVIVYNTSKIKNPPKSWKALLEHNYGDRLALPDISNTTGMLVMLMLNKVSGGDLDNVDPGLKTVKTLLDRGAQILSTGPEVQNAFAQGTIDVIPFAADYAYTVKKAGLPVDYIVPEEGTVVYFSTANVVANRPNSDLAKKFVDFEINASSQVAFAEALRVSPTNRTANLAPEVAKDTIYGEEAASKVVRLDPEKLQANRPKWVQQWNRTIAK